MVKMVIKYNYVVVFIVFSVCELILCQDDGVPEQSNIICETCTCTENLVDCTNKNMLTLFEEEDWAGLSAEINLSYNSIKEVKMIPEVPVKVLNLSHCQINKIEKGSFRNLESLESLDLSYNDISTSAMDRGVLMSKIEDPPGIIKQYTNMRYLSLSNNEIHSLPLFAFASMVSVAVLDLSGNPLQYIDQVTLGSLSDLVNLRELYLSSCELEVLPEGIFRRQRQLHTVDLSNNKFTTIPAVLPEAANLRSLNFDGNSLEILDENNPLKSMTKLQELRLCKNSKLKSISAFALGGLTNLAVLRISYNPRLSSIDPQFLENVDEHGDKNWPELKELYLNKNNLSVISSHYLHRWDQLTVCDVSNNPYNCDCNSQWMIDVLVDLLQGRGDGVPSDMICVSPPELRGATFYNLRNTTRVLNCPESESLSDFSASNTAIMFGITIGVFVTFPIVLIIILLWRKGHFARCRSMKQESNQEELEHF